MTITSSHVTDFGPFDRFVLQKPTWEVGESKDQLKPAPEEMDFPETPQDPLTTNHGKAAQHFTTRNLSFACQESTLAKGMETCFCALDQMTTQSYNLLLSGSKAKR